VQQEPPLAPLQLHKQTRAIISPTGDGTVGMKFHRPRCRFSALVVYYIIRACVSALILRGLKGLIFISAAPRQENHDDNEPFQFSQKIAVPQARKYLFICTRNGAKA